ncbi:MAG TPA: ABC transporter ATP-binding protein [Cyclobacteriaceae bacterium]|nr:ABC transporter ATP-binding protein [Cyclobacteriaceae bacterium]
MMIAVKGLSFSYNGSNELRFADWLVNKAEPCLLLGESGSGKTTLLHLLGGFIRPNSGSIEIAGKDTTQLSEAALDKFRGKHMGMIFQKPHLITALSVEKNLLMAPFMAGLEQSNEKVEIILEELGIADKRKAKVYELSQGQAQRVAIARALLNEPEVILADEPTSALDDKNCDKVIDLLLKLSQKHQATLLVATHDQRLKDKISKQINLN